MRSSAGSPFFRIMTGLFRFVLLPSLICLIFVGIWPPRWSLAAEPAPRAPRTRIIADRSIDRVVNGERITYLLGNVFIDRDSLTASADTVRYYRDREVYEFLGRVVDPGRRGAELPARFPLSGRGKR